ncbi:hypothetical protein Tco_1337467 [Tanacetum coccineum]
MANLPPNHNEFAPAAEAAPDNMNGWGADPLYPPPPASDPESEAEVEAKVAHIPPPVLANHEPEAEVAPIPPPPIPVNPEPKAVTVGTGRLTPLKRLFTDTQVWIGSSSYSTAASHDPEDLTPSHIRSDLDALHRVASPHNQVGSSPEGLRVPVTHNDPRDPYIAARDAATAPAIDNDDPPTHEETSPS